MIVIGGDEGLDVLDEGVVGSSANHPQQHLSGPLMPDSSPSALSIVNQKTGGPFDSIPFAVQSDVGAGNESVGTDFLALEEQLSNCIASSCGGDGAVEVGKEFKLGLNANEEKEESEDDDDEKDESFDFIVAEDEEDENEGDSEDEDDEEWEGVLAEEEECSEKQDNDGGSESDAGDISVSGKGKRKRKNANTAKTKSKGGRAAKDDSDSESIMSLKGMESLYMDYFDSSGSEASYNVEDDLCQTDVSVEEGRNDYGVKVPDQEAAELRREAMEDLPEDLLLRKMNDKPPVEEEEESPKYTEDTDSWYTPQNQATIDAVRNVQNDINDYFTAPVLKQMLELSDRLNLGLFMQIQALQKVSVCGKARKDKEGGKEAEKETARPKHMKSRSQIGRLQEILSESTKLYRIARYSYSGDQGNPPAEKSLLDSGLIYAIDKCWDPQTGDLKTEPQGTGKKQQGAVFELMKGILPFCTMEEEKVSQLLQPPISVVSGGKATYVEPETTLLAMNFIMYGRNFSAIACASFTQSEKGNLTNKPVDSLKVKVKNEKSSKRKLSSKELPSLIQICRRAIFFKDKEFKGFDEQFTFDKYSCNLLKAIGPFGFKRVFYQPNCLPLFIRKQPLEGNDGRTSSEVLYEAVAREWARKNENLHDGVMLSRKKKKERALKKEAKKSTSSPVPFKSQSPVVNGTKGNSKAGPEDARMMTPAPPPTVKRSRGRPRKIKCPTDVPKEAPAKRRKAPKTTSKISSKPPCSNLFSLDINDDNQYEPMDLFPQQLLDNFNAERDFSVNGGLLDSALEPASFGELEIIPPPLTAIIPSQTDKKSAASVCDKVLEPMTLNNKRPSPLGSDVAAVSPFQPREKKLSFKCVDISQKAKRNLRANIFSPTPSQNENNFGSTSGRSTPLPVSATPSIDAGHTDSPSTKSDISILKPTRSNIDNLFRPEENSMNSGKSPCDYSHQESYDSDWSSSSSGITPYHELASSESDSGSSIISIRPLSPPPSSQHRVQEVLIATQES
eukprot:Nk52_evm31s621 gene=Nk52_evmTU31s621